MTCNVLSGKLSLYTTTTTTTTVNVGHWMIWLSYFGRYGIINMPVYHDEGGTLSPKQCTP